MLQRLIRLVATRPDLLADHAGAYAELASAEAAGALARLQRQVLFGAVALCAFGVACTLAGVALLLWAALPLAAMPRPGLLLVVPLLPALLALGCAMAARSPAAEPAFTGLRRQWQSDVQMLHEAAVP